MHHARFLLAVAIVCPLLLTSCKESPEEIRAAFDQLVSGINQGNPGEAIAVIDPRYFEHMDYLAKMARTGTREKVLALPIHERMEVVAMRNRLTKAELASLTGEGWVRLMIERGWGASDPGDPILSIGKVTFKPPRAFGELLVEGMRTKLTVEFVKTNDVWLVDPRSMDEFWGDWVAKNANSRSGLDKLILDLESMESGKRVNQTIWDPPK